MAERVQVRGVDVKVRTFWAPLVWIFLTLGVYYFVWYYKVNRELARYGRAAGRDLGDSPGVSLLAISLGALVIVPMLVSWFNTFGRIRDAEEVAAVAGERTSVWIGLAFTVIAPFFVPIEVLYAQYQLNRVWRAELGATSS